MAKESTTFSALWLALGLLGMCILAGLVTLLWRFFTFGKAF
jgi:hypothetical protein